MAWQVLFFYFGFFSMAAPNQFYYSILEELKLNSIIGNVAEDLGLDSSNLKMRKLRIVSHHSRNYFNISAENGNLYVSDRIDREEICGAEPSCFLDLEILAENPVNVFPLKIEIQDINDNPPSFSKDSFTVRISESALPGARFVLGNARDPDLGSNSLHNYNLTPNPYFSLVEKSESQREYPELSLVQSLDREMQQKYELTLTAFDGGKPMRSGTAVVRVLVQDANDNYPVFSQNNYEVSLDENLPINYLVVHLNATDKDEGSNAEISYSFSHIPENALKVFTMDSQTGIIKTKGELDFETTQTYEITVEASDGGGLIAQSSVLINIMDVNDNAPEITIASLSTPIPEDSGLGTLVALINVKDLDSGKYGEVNCEITEIKTLKLVPSSNNYFKLVTAGELDREIMSAYNITIIAEDEGSPPMVTKKTVHISVSDVNDNEPVFDKPLYISYIPEHIPAGTSIQNIHASDLDENENARVMYTIINRRILMTSQ
ncbi:unnamed protein product [Ranitomeya imitator]|uniref:Cadherin domain-containing protein n=1 Tax=Ranitomeya imitator TaxID=111125 RepID=A0ABN9M746_9NEOB|nr:unnamed protein product [Ranitomeya imitator]